MDRKNVIEGLISWINTLEIPGSLFVENLNHVLTPPFLMNLIKYIYSPSNSCSNLDETIEMFVKKIYPKWDYKQFVKIEGNELILQDLLILLHDIYIHKTSETNPYSSKTPKKKLILRKATMPCQKKKITEIQKPQSFSFTKAQRIDFTKINTQPSKLTRSKSEKKLSNKNENKITTVKTLLQTQKQKQQQNHQNLKSISPIQSPMLEKHMYHIFIYLYTRTITPNGLIYNNSIIDPLYYKKYSIQTKNENIINTNSIYTIKNLSNEIMNIKWLNDLNIYTNNKNISNFYKEFQNGSILLKLCLYLAKGNDFMNGKELNKNNNNDNNIKKKFEISIKIIKYLYPSISSDLINLKELENGNVNIIQSLISYLKEKHENKIQNNLLKIKNTIKTNTTETPTKTIKNIKIDNKNNSFKFDKYYYSTIPDIYPPNSNRESNQLHYLQTWLDSCNIKFDIICNNNSNKIHLLDDKLRNGEILYEILTFTHLKPKTFNHSPTTLTQIYKNLEICMKIIKESFPDDFNNEIEFYKNEIIISNNEIYNILNILSKRINPINNISNNEAIPINSTINNNDLNVSISKLSEMKEIIYSWLITMKFSIDISNYSYIMMLNEIQNGTLLNELIYIVFNKKILNIATKTNIEYFNIINMYININTIVSDHLNEFLKNDITIWTYLLYDIYEYNKDNKENEANSMYEEESLTDKRNYDILNNSSPRYKYISS